MQDTLESLKGEQVVHKEALESILAKVNKLENLHEDVGYLKETTDGLKNDINDAYVKLDDVENRLRRNNLVFHGIPEEGNETWDEAEVKVVDVLKRKLQHDIESRAIDRAHRLGRKVPGRIRPIIVKFAFFKDKDAIFRKKNTFVWF